MKNGYGIIRKNILGEKMNKGFVLFLTGLLLNLSGIYLSTSWPLAGSLSGVLGGLMLGLSTYFLAVNINTKNK
ncbi:hypothetical protein V7201_15050 [Bacillus sp. JJ1122]